jgi:hypothetical protein
MALLLEDEMMHKVSKAELNKRFWRCLKTENLKKTIRIISRGQRQLSYFTSWMQYVADLPFCTLNT